MTEPTHALVTKSRIGYLPEEQGLYEDMTLLDTLHFLGHFKNLTRQTVLAAGADAFVLKGDNPEQLITTIRQLVVGGR
jgi:ABC-type uncharacterized transport system ATPase subunit